MFPPRGFGEALAALAFSLYVKRGKLEDESERALSARPKDMAIPAVCRIRSATRRSPSSMEYSENLPHFRTGDGEGVASKVRQLKAVVNPPIASVLQFTDCGPSTMRTRNLRPRVSGSWSPKSICDPLEHPPKPARRLLAVSNETSFTLHS